MRVLPLLATLALTVSLLAGCADEAPDVPPAQSLPAQLAAQLEPAPQWDAVAGLEWWADFAQTYAYRMAFTPANQDATNHLAQSMAELGFEVEVLTYGACAPLVGQPACAPQAVGPVQTHVVAALLRGATQPDHAVALGAHYDNVYPGLGLTTGTVEAAYDNGSGTAMVYNLCKQLAQVPLEKSLLCLFFDGEEEGALGSSLYVANPPASHPAIDVYLGYDMVGINWPGPVWKLYNWVDAEHALDLHPFVNATVNEVLQWPAEGVEVFPKNDRNSDEASFISAHIPTIRFAGGRTAGAYPAYHELNDTVQFVDAFVGGRANFALGFGAILEESVLLARMLDRTDLPAIQAWVEG
ncbi:MAG: M28 family peptidase [Candidatus Thermoplasmatota archaeon]